METKDFSTFWIDTSLKHPIELLHAYYVKHAFTPHAHEQYAIGIIIKGAQALKYRQKTEILPEGHICILNPAEQHTGQAKTKAGWYYRMFYPDAKLFKDLASNLSDKPTDYPFFKNIVVQDRLLTQQLLYLHQCFENPHSSLLEKEELFYTVMSNFIIRHSQFQKSLLNIGKEPCAVLKACEYIQDNLDREVTLDDLSTLTGISKFHFLRVFKQALNLTPAMYLTMKRIQKAKRLLLTNTNMALIANECGFFDQSHFIKKFKGFTGVTPGEFQKSIHFYH